MPWWLLPVTGAVVGTIYAVLRVLQYLSEKEDTEQDE